MFLKDQLSNKNWFLLLLGAVITSLLFLSAINESKAQSQELTKWCAGKYGAEWFGTRRRSDNAPMCSRKTFGGLGLEHRVVPKNEYCPLIPCTPKAKVKKSKKFKQPTPSPIQQVGGQRTPCPTGQVRRPAKGFKFSCVDIPKPVVNTQPQSLDTWCRNKFGPDWFGSQRRTDGSPLCSRRTNGGLGLEHRVIAKNQLCAGGDVKVNQLGKFFECTNSAAPGAGSIQKKQASQTPQRQNPGSSQGTGKNTPGNKRDTDQRNNPQPSPVEIKVQFERCKKTYGDNWKAAYYQVGSKLYFIKNYCRGPVEDPSIGDSLTSWCNKKAGLQYGAKLNITVTKAGLLKELKILGQCNFWDRPQPVYAPGEVVPPIQSTPQTFDIEVAELCPNGTLVLNEYRPGDVDRLYSCAKKLGQKKFEITLDW